MKLPWNNWSKILIFATTKNTANLVTKDTKYHFAVAMAKVKFMHGLQHSLKVS